MKPVAPMPEVTTLDALARPLRDLRISLTDRCNFRCTYCMPRHVFGPDHEFLPRAELLDFDEIVRSARIFAELGVRKLRITGGEPLLRPDLETLIERLAALPGIEDISLTTNASRLTAERARALRSAGLRRMTISLDAIDDATFRRIVDVQTPVARVLEAIGHAVDAGLAPVKINAVIKRGLNDDQIEPLAEYFRHSGCVLRFIEFMDVGASNGWKLDAVVPAAEIVQRLQARWPLAPLDANYAGETANRWRYRDGAGEIGVIASVSEPFCGGCSRARLSAEGRLYTCLFASQGFDLRALLRDGADDETLHARLGALWGARTDRYSELRTEETAATRKVEMSYIGG